MEETNFTFIDWYVWGIIAVVGIIFIIVIIKNMINHK